jgi:hypothetical protein
MAAAEFDARRRIAERIDRLTTPSGRTMSDILLGGAVSKMDIQRFMQGAVRVGRAEVDSDGLMRVTLRIPLRGLWRLVRHADDAPDKRG